MAIAAAAIPALITAAQNEEDILTKVVSYMETTEKIVKKFEGATNFKDRTRSLELTVANGTNHNLEFTNQYFDSGTFFVSPDPLVIPPGGMSLLFVANKQGGIMTGVTGGLEYKLEGTEYSLYMGFTNPYAGSYKNFIAVDAGKSAEWAYDNSENDEVKRVTSHGYKLTCTMRDPKISPYKRFDYIIIEK